MIGVIEYWSNFALLFYMFRGIIYKVSIYTRNVLRNPWNITGEHRYNEKE